MGHALPGLRRWAIEFGPCGAKSVMAEVVPTENGDHTPPKPGESIFLLAAYRNTPAPSAVIRNCFNQFCMAGDNFDSG